MQRVVHVRTTQKQDNLPLSRAMETNDSVQVARQQSPSSLLGLPSFLRHHVYSHIGLVHTNKCGLPYVFQLHGSNRPEFCAFHGLLLSCRTLHDEAIRLLYSANRFVIRYGEQLSLEPLRSLTPLALSNLRHLKVVLNQACCHSSAALCSGFADPYITDEHKFIPNLVNGTNQHCRLRLTAHVTVLLGDEGDLKLLAEWKRTIKHLSSRISPVVLDLSVVCDIFDEDIDMAKRVVSPLALLPLLKDCHVRLSHVPTPEMNRLAKDAALKVCGRFRPPYQLPTSCPPVNKNAALLHSRLMALPRELRLQILEYTDLVTPWKEVKWHRKDRVFSASRTFCTSVTTPGGVCKVHHGCQFVNCWHTYPEPSIGCFCPLKHSALSWHCKCWVPPPPLLLMCRALFKEAQTVLFSQNRFVTHDSNPPGPLRAPLARPSPRFTASVFLDETVPRDCLGHLRSLEFPYP